MAVGPLWTLMRVVNDASSTVPIPLKRLGSCSVRRRVGLEGFGSAVTAETAVREHAGGAPGKKGGSSRSNVDVEVGIDWIALISCMPLPEGATRVEDGLEGGPTLG